MERLTWRTTAGTPNFKMEDAIRKDNIARSAFYQLACHSLAAYEDTNLTPDEIKDHEEMFKAYRHVCGGLSPDEIERMKAELEQYRVDEANGQLIRLPRKVGGTVYWNNGIRVSKQVIYGYIVDGNGNLRYAFMDFEPIVTSNHVFLNREEAEAALLKGESK